MACVAFGIVRFIPGDPVSVLLGDQATPENILKAQRALGLDGTLPDQFLSFIGRLIRGDLGTSYVTGQPVADLVMRSLPVTLELILVTLALCMALAVPLGLGMALVHSTRIEAAYRLVTSTLLAMPVFFTGLLALLVLAVRLEWAPVAGYEPGFPGNVGYLWLPAAVICTHLVPVLSRVVRGSVLETIEQEFVETAITRGVHRPAIFWKYLLRPSLGPPIALMAYIVGQLLAAAVIVELLFDLPGIGRALLDAIAGRDYPVVQGVTLVFGLVVVVVGYISDVASELIDPRLAISPR